MPELRQDMQVRELESSENGAWESYITSHPSTTLSHRIGWKKVMEDSFGHRTHYLAAWRGDRIAGVLPVVHVRSRIFGSILCSMPFLNSGGVAADDDETARALLKEAGELVRRAGADYLELRQCRRSVAELPTKTNKVSMVVDLDPDPEVVFGAFKSKQRTIIRRSLKSGLEIRFGHVDLLDDFYRILCRGWRNLGTPVYAKSFFKKVLESLGDAVEITVVMHRGEVVAAAFDGFHGDAIEGIWTYALREHARLQTNYFLYWHLIRKGCERGYRSYRLGRSTVGSTAVAYKRKWNARSEQLYWEYVLGQQQEIPQLNVDNPRYRMAIAAWRKLPVWVTRLVGPRLAKSIP